MWVCLIRASDYPSWQLSARRHRTTRWLTCDSISTQPRMRRPNLIHRSCVSAGRRGGGSARKVWRSPGRVLDVTQPSPLQDNASRKIIHHRRRRQEVWVSRCSSLLPGKSFHRWRRPERSFSDRGWRQHVDFFVIISSDFLPRGLLESAWDTSRKTYSIGFKYHAVHRNVIKRSTYTECNVFHKAILVDGFVRTDSIKFHFYVRSIQLLSHPFALAPWSSTSSLFPGYRRQILAKWAPVSRPCLLSSCSLYEHLTWRLLFKDAPLPPVSTWIEILSLVG